MKFRAVKAQRRCIRELMPIIGHRLGFVRPAAIFAVMSRTAAVIQLMEVANVAQEIILVMLERHFPLKILRGLMRNGVGRCMVLFNEGCYLACSFNAFIIGPLLD